MQKIATIVNSFANKTEIPVSFILLPNSIYIYQDKLPPNTEIYNQRDIIESFYKKLTEKIKPIHTIDMLMANKNQYIYFKTDHHQTSLGAYLAYSAWTIQKGEIPVDLRRFEKITISENFLGTFDSKAQIYKQEPDRIDIYLNEKNLELKEVQYDTETTTNLFNEQYLSKKDKYSYFLNGNNAKVVATTNNTNGKKILIIKDSYAHIMAQFLCQDYEQLHFIDPRYYKASMTEYIKENEITEVLFIYNISNIINDMGLLTLK